MKKQRTPQEKKRLSLAKDRRTVDTNNTKSARKGIPRTRANKNRNYRRNVRQAIASELKEASDSPESIDDATSKVRCKRWKKWSPDVPLGEVLKQKQERRARTGQTRK